jgi:hypothetical protein
LHVEAERKTSRDNGKEARRENFTVRQRRYFFLKLLLPVRPAAFGNLPPFGATPTENTGAIPMKIAAYFAALRLKKLLAERQAKNEQPRIDDRIADYGDNGNEAQFYLIVDNFR